MAKDKIILTNWIASRVKRKYPYINLLFNSFLYFAKKSTDKQISIRLKHDSFSRWIPPA